MHHLQTWRSVATITLERGPTTIVIRDTPAEICQNCGETYHTETVLRQAEAAAQAGVEFDVRRYTQAA